MKNRILATTVFFISLFSAAATDPATGNNPPPGMVFVPAGQFVMGSDMYQKDEKPIRKVTLDAFYIDTTEVTVAQYAKCRASRRCKGSRGGKAFGQGFPKMGPDHPVIGVSWHNAEDFCAWAGKRLPTEAEWEKAARGENGNPFPWGTEIDCNKANYFACNVGHPVRVGSYPSGKSPYGALDMAGNVQEWVADWYAPDYYSKAPDTNPKGPEQGDRRVLKGGSYDYVWSSLRASYRNRELPQNWDNGIGFRCAKGL